MKKIIVMMLIILMLISCNSESLGSAFLNEELSVSAVLRGWDEAYGCRDGYGNCAIAIEDENFVGSGAFNVELRKLDSNTLLLHYVDENEVVDVNSYLNFRKPVVLSSTIVATMELNGNQILSGSYQIDSNKDVYLKIIKDL